MWARLVQQGYLLCRKFLEDRNRSRDFYLGLIVLAFALTLLIWLTPTFVSSPLAQSHLKVRPSTFPNLISYVLVLLSVFLIYNSPQSSRDATRIEDKRFSWFVVLCIALLFTYYVGVRLIGMLPASIVILFVLIRLYGFRSWYLSILIALIVPILLFVFFEKLAQVQIPRGILFEDWP
jgi:putative tricarboxylic transport membrane protein